MKTLTKYLLILSTAIIFSGCGDSTTKSTVIGGTVIYKIVKIDGKYYLASKSYGYNYIVGPEVSSDNPQVTIIK